jgi:hypothetical protein
VAIPRRHGADRRQLEVRHVPRFLFVLALGSFAIGTDAFVIAGILPDVAASLSVTVRGAGLLVSGFALVYALGGPILAVSKLSGSGKALVTRKSVRWADTRPYPVGSCNPTGATH